MSISARFKMAGWLILFAALIYFPLFLHLTSLSVRVFDESRLALNAYEMIQTGNIIVTYHEGMPDMWNTKPPLMIWLLAISIKFFGLNELAIRLPAAFAALATCILLLVFAQKVFQNFLLGLIAAVVLVTSNGYVEEHVARTGDYDSLLVFLNCSLLLCFFIYTESSDEKKKTLLLLFFILLLLSLLCKGIGGLLFLPAIGIYLLARKQIGATIRLRNFYVGLAIFIVFGLGYYLLREKLNPGYLRAVADNELGGRYFKAYEGHRGSFSYYFRNLVATGFSYWFWLLPCGWLVGILSADPKLRRMTLFLLISIVTYIIIISYSQTKIEWYSAPLYPLMAFSVAIFLNWCFELVCHSKFLKVNSVRPVIGYLMLFIVFAFPYRSIINKVYIPKNIASLQGMYEIPDYLKYVAAQNIRVDGCNVIFKGWPSSILFYQKELDKMNQHIILSSVNELHEGDCAIISQDEMYNRILGRFVVDTLEVFNNVRRVHVDRRK